jgi:hypothetical protein
MVVTPRGHTHCGQATKIFKSKPTTVTTNEGTRLRASYLFCLLKAGQMAVKPRGRRQRGRATKILNSKPTAVKANEGTRLRASNVGRAKGRVNVGGTAMINDLNEEIFRKASDSAVAPTFVNG